MKITVVGSMAFAGKMVETYRKLREMGHEPQMREGVFGIADGTARELIEGIRQDHGALKRRLDIIRSWHDLIVAGDAILVCNFDKNGIKNYIGGNTLMEIGFAHVNRKKVFLLNPIPDMPYTPEIKAMVDVVLDGRLEGIGRA